MRLSTGVRRSLAATALLTLASACGSDSTGPKQPAFTVQEATAIAFGMFEEVSIAISNTGIASSRSPASAQFSAVPVTNSQNFNSSCTNGGSISGKVSFSEDLDALGSGTASGAVTATSQGCQINAGTRLIAVGGQATYAFNIKVSPDGSLDTFEWRGAGNFTWEGGSCVIDYTMTLSGAANGGGTLKGTICGVDISQTI